MHLLITVHYWHCSLLPATIIVKCAGSSFFGTIKLHCLLCFKGCWLIEQYFEQLKAKRIETFQKKIRTNFDLKNLPSSNPTRLCCLYGPWESLKMKTRDHVMIRLRWTPPYPCCSVVLVFDVILPLEKQKGWPVVLYSRQARDLVRGCLKESLDFL